MIRHPQFFLAKAKLDDQEALNELHEAYQVSQFILLEMYKNLNPNTTREGQICPTVFQTLIPLETNVGLTSNEAVNLSFWFVFRPI